MKAPRKEALFTSRNDPDDPRIGDALKAPQGNPSRTKWCILGYPCDQGIKLNGGRPGAAQAPDEIRRALYKMVLPANFSARDLGDLDISGDLVQDHRAAFEKTLSILAHTAVLSLGGGHDWAYPDGMAFINWAKEHLAPTTKNPVKPLIVNFDAHLDLRPIPNGAVHSGNPFRKLILETPLPFDLLEVGIQDHCNAKAHMKFAQDHAVSVLKLEDCTKLEFLDCLQAFLPESSQTQGKTRSKPKRPCFISVDIDSLSQVFAPGASASYPTGLKISFLLWAIKILKSQFAVKIAGIYEVSPPYDIEGITAKSAALVAYEILKD